MASSIGIGIGIRSSAAVAGAASIVAAGDREPMRDVRSCVRARGGRSVGAFDARAARSRVGVNWISESSSLLVLTLVASQCRCWWRRCGRLRRGDADVRYDNDEYDNSFYAWYTGGMSGVV